MKKLLAAFSIFLGVTGILYTSNNAEAKKPALDSIKDIVVANENFDILEAAVVKAGLAEVLDGKKQYTVFAPTDEAFDKTAEVALGPGKTGMDLVATLDEATLRNILLYHVTNGRRISPSVLGAPTYNMLNGDKLTRTELTTAGIAQTDISTSNGIIHIINGVLLPN
jgi:uncharacterized surface protein with fasciclin (FAS1) repeats